VMNWRARSLDVVTEAETRCPCVTAAILLIAQSVMCDASIRRLPTSFSIEDIISSDDKHQHPPVSADRHLPVVVVRPWEMQTTNVMAGIDEACLRLTAAAAALTLCHWQAINRVSPLCALYKMTTRSFADSLNCDKLQGIHI